MNAASQNASPKWSDIAADESFQQATPEVRQQVRDQFFSKVVEPATPEALRGEVREKFYSQTAGDIGGQGGLAIPEEQRPAEPQHQGQPQRPQGGQQRPSGLAMPNASEEERNAAWEAAWKAEGVQNPQQDTGVNIDVSKANADSNLLTDAGNLLAIGADKMALNFREATRQVLGENVVNALDRVDEFLNGKPSEDLLSDRIEDNESQITDATRAAQQKEFITEDEDGNYQLGPAWKDPRTYFAGITESLPEMAATMAPSTLLAKAAYGYRLARGATRAQAAASAARTATAAGALSEGALGGAAASRDVREAIESMPDEMLRESDAIQMLMLEGKTFDEAKKTITEDLQSQTFMVAGAITGAFGGAGDRFLAKLLTEGGSGRFAAMLRGGVAEGLLEEAPQEGGQQIAKNRALGVVDDSVGTFDDVPNAMAGGAAIGGVMGGGLGLAGGGRPALPQDEAPGATPSAEAAPESAPDVADADVVDRVTSDLDLLRSNRRDLDDAGRERRDSLIDGDAYKELRARAEELGMDEAVIELEQARRVAGEAFEQETLAAQSGSQESMEAARSLSSQAADRLQSALDMMRGGPQAQTEAQAETQADPQAEPEASQAEAPEVKPTVNRAQSDIGNRLQIAQDGLADLGRAARRSGYQAETRTRAADQLLRRARQAFEAGRTDEAERLLGQADRQTSNLRRDMGRSGTTESPARATGEYETDRPVGLLGMDGRRLNAPEDVIYAEGPAVDRTEYEAPARKVRRDEELQRQAAARRQADQDLQARAQSDQPLLGDAGIVYGEGPTQRRGNANTGLDMPSSSDPRYVQDQLDRAAQETDVNPTPAQAEAGNYRKGRVNFNGVDIAIENPRGFTRRGKDADGTAWESTLAHHYGDIKGTKGADGDNIDVFIGENLDSPKVYVVDQVDRDGNFDEHKVMMGFRDEAEARRGYQGNYPKDWNGIGAVTELTPQQFKEWIRDADTTLPVGEVVNRDSAGMGTQANTGSDRAGDTEGALDQNGEAGAAESERTRGRSETVYLPDNTPVNTRFRVIDAAELQPSNSPVGRVNPNYPAELQPRDRTNANSQVQVRNIAARLNPERLSSSRDASTGAPIIGPDGVVESGNGRVMAISYAYQQGSERADAYRDFIRFGAQEYGIDPTAVDKMAQPVLVRERVSDVDRADFARRANESQVAGMTAYEQALADADSLSNGDLQTWAPDQSGDPLAASNRDFQRVFVQRMGNNEAARYTTRSGQASPELGSRMQRAVFAKAFNDADMVEMVTEQSDQMRNLAAALQTAAPDLAIARETGSKEAEDAISTIVDAVRIVRQARHDGVSVIELTRQGDAFSDPVPETTAFLASAIQANLRSRRALSEAMRHTGHAVRSRAENERNVALFEDTTTNEDVFNAAFQNEDSVARPEKRSPQGDVPSGAKRRQRGVAGGRQAEAAAGSETDQQESEVDGSPLLTTYDEQDLADREQAQQQAEQADTDARRQEQERAQADRDVDDFILSGSDLPADQAVSRGQNPLFSFAGSRASNADLHTLERAQRMLENGQDSEAIRQETGWFEGVDGKWRFEIDDSDARFLPFVDKSAGTQWTKSLEEVVDHPRLFAAYPTLRDVTVVSVIGMGRKRGRYAPKRREITLNAELDPMEQFSTLLHEVQHGIQHLEGFASGGSPESYRLPPRREQWLRNKIQELTHESGDFAREVLEQYKAGELTSDQVQQRIQQRADEIGLNELRKKLSEGNERGAYRYYQRLYGETEARNVQARQGMSEIERRDTSPAETQDVPDSEVVVVYNGLEMAGAPGPANARATAATNGPAITQAKDIAAALEGVKELSDTRVIQATQELPPSALVGMALRGIDPADVRGMYIGGDLYVIADNVGSIKEGVQTAVHEAVGHKGIRAVLGEELAPSMLSLYHSLPKSRRGREALEEVRRDYPFLDPAKREDRITIGEEMVAHLLEKGYRPKAWQRAVAKLRELLRRLFPSIAWTYGDVLALGEKSRDHLRRQQAERNSAQAKRTITRYSKRKTENPLLTPIRHEAEIYRRDLNKAMSSKHSKVPPIRMGRTPPVLASLGAPDLPISITRDVVNKATSAKHHVSMETIQRLPELLHDPVAILDSRTSQDALVVLVNAVDAKGKAVLVPIHLNKRQQYIHVNRVASVYGKDGAQRFVERGIEEGRVRYVNTRKSPEWLQSSRLQLPGEGAPSRGFDKSVLTPDDIVNQAQRYAMAPSPSPVGAYSDNDSTNFSLPDEALVGKALRVLTDKMRPLNKLQEAITKHGGRVTQDNDVYLAEELFHGKAEHDLRQIRERYVERLAEGMAQSGISQEALDEYLYARHAPERNARIAERNPGDPRYSDGGSGMKTQAALDILDRINSGPKRDEFERLAGIVDDMLRTQREAIREGGLETDETLDAWEASYRYYVPLKGFAEDDKADPGRARSGRGFEIKGKESKTALGRLSRADSPSTQAIVDTTQAIIRRRKNEVGNALLSLVTDNPNPDLWQVYTNDNPDTQRVRVAVKDPSTGRDKIEVRERPVAMEGDERYFKTKKAGRTFYIKIKDERLMNAMRNVGPEKNGMIVNAMGAVTRLMASLVTSYNPEFMLTNFARDVQTALLNLQAEQSKADGKIRGKRIVRQTMRDLRPAMAAAYRGLSSRQGKTPKARQWDRYFQEFMEDGAKTGYFDMKDIQGQAKEIASMMRRASGGTVGSALVFRKKTADFVENINGAVENASRLSAYVNARRAGVSRKKAASLAKNMTVNFNRRGELGSMFNAFYMFFNASVQGTRNFARTMVGLREVDEDSGRANVWSRMNTAQRTALAMAAGSFLLAMVNRSLSEEDDDGELFWDKIPAHEKERNLIFMTGDKDYVKIPLPYGYNVFSVLGTQAEALTRGDKPAVESSLETVLAILGSFSPIGFEGSDESVNALAKNITPTLFRSITQVAVNEDFAGRPVYKENLPFGTPKPDSTLAFRSNPDAYQGFTRFLNEAFGGSEYRSGAVDISPEVLQHVVNFYGGGAWGFAEKTGDFVRRLTTGEDVERFRVPFAGRFASNVSEYGDIQSFYERRDEVGQYAKEFENLPLNEVEDYYVDYGPMIELFDLAKDVEENLSALREVRDIIEADESLTAVERQERLKELDEVMDAEVDYFNLEYRLAKESL
ncbi:LPD38 domain-containing protein [Halomonas cupida]|uniref:LPD38 domain-containing protein n=1 Tax=Halomonas cupida TaxID=44933 RepID=UPI003EF958B6